jgi:uncharacterized protein YuzE
MQFGNKLLVDSGQKMKVCGIEIKGSEAILVIAESADGEIQHVAVETRKIALEDDEAAAHVKSFSKTIDGFARENKLDLIAIKKRMKKGEYAGGPVTFKIEGLIQLIESCEVRLLAAQTIKAANAKQPVQPPLTLKKYQHEAFGVACAAAIISTK